MNNEDSHEILSCSSLRVSHEPSTKKIKTGTPVTQLLNDEEWKRHLQEMSAEVLKPKPNQEHVKRLLDESHASNRRWMSGLDDGQLSPILETVPCYKDGYYVSSWAGEY